MEHATKSLSLAASDLRQIAQTCLRYGGRAVLSARGLCEVWLKEYYDEGNCDGNLQARSSGENAVVATELNPAFRIVPNPADDMIRIYLNAPVAEGENLKVQFLNMNGQEVYMATMIAGSGELAVPVHGWHEGVYVARVVRDSEPFSQIFIVQHR